MTKEHNMNHTYHYIIDSKLLFYTQLQIGQDVLTTVNKIAEILSQHPQGTIYLAADIGTSSYRLGVSRYYKGKRREDAAKKTQEEQDAHAVFSAEYIQFVELCKTLPMHIMDVPNTEADDVASILAYRLAKDPHNRIGLVTRDQDWCHSVIDDNNVKLISPYFREDDIYSPYVKETYSIANREEFTLKKTLAGDAGDSICNITGIGTKKVDEIWASCKMHPEVTLDVVRQEIHAYIDKQKNPGRFTAHKKYIEYGVANTVDELIDVNYKLAPTMTDMSLLTPEQQDALSASLKRPLPTTLPDLFGLGIAHFGRPITLSQQAKEFYERQIRS